jgi:SAM-dependent methyltransferase
MGFSLNLPYSVCWPLVRMIRRQGAVASPRLMDPVAYFREQYASTPSVANRFMQGLDFEQRFVIDVGGGLGGRMPYFFDRGARQVWCIDINREELRLGEQIMRTEFPQYADRARFFHPDEVPAGANSDLAVLVDSFEHLVNPTDVLDQCAANLGPGGYLWIGSIGWYNQMASHCRVHIPIPWCQLLFSEEAILKTIRTLLHSPGYRPVYWEVVEGLDRWDNIHSLKDRPGEPLNQLSLRQIKRVLIHPAFEMKRFELHPIAEKRLVGRVVRPLLKVPGLDEVLHGYYTAVLRRR